MSYQIQNGFAGRNENLFAVTASSRGTNMTANASINTKGSWITAANPSFQYEYIVVALHAGASATDYLVDIGIDDGSGNVFILVPNLRLPNARVARVGTARYGIPVRVPSGANLTARCAAAIGSATCAIVINGYASGWMGMPGLTKAIALYTPNGSRGAAVDPGGVANTKTRTQLVASSSDRVGGIFYQVGWNGDTGRTVTARAAFDIETGASSAERLLFDDQYFMWGSLGDGPVPHCSPIIPCDVKAGERFSINALCDITTAGDRTFDFALWGLVP